MGLSSTLIYTILSLLASAIAWGLAVLGWRRRNVAGARPFMALMAAVGWWSLVYGVELVSRQPMVVRWSARLEYVGIVIVPVAWFLFVQTYTLRWPEIRLRRVLLLSIVPAITLALVLTNDAHGLIWREYEVLPSDSSANFVVAAYGPAFWLNTAYANLLLAVSSVWMIVFLWRSRASYRWQAVVLFIGVLLPWIANLIYVLGDIDIDLTPTFFALSGALFAWGMFRLRLLDLAPVAQRAVVDGIGDAIIVVDLAHRVVEANPTALALVGLSINQVVGHTLDELLPDHKDVVMRYRKVEKARDEISLSLDGEPRVFDLRLYPLRDRREALVGRLIVLRDITERKALETSLAFQVERVEQLLEVARAMTVRPNLDATLKNTLDIAVSLTEASRGSFFLLDADHQVTHSILARGKTPARVSHEIAEKVLERGLEGQVLRAKAAVLIEDVGSDPRWRKLPDQPYTVGSVLGIPIIEGDLLLGILTLIHETPGHFTAKDTDIMTAAAQQMALALRNAMIYEEQRRMADQQATLYEVLRTLQRTRNPENMLGLAITTIARLTDWDFIGVLGPDEDGEQLHFEATGGRPDMRPTCDFSLEIEFIEQVWRSGRTKYIPNVQGSPVAHEALCDAASALLVPMQQGKRKRLIYIASDEMWAFDRDTQLLAASLGDVIALAIQNAELYATLQNNYQRIESLFKVSRLLVGGIELREVLQRVLNAIFKALTADRVSLVLLDLEAEKVRDFLAAGPGADLVVKVPYAELMEGLTGWVVQHRNPALSHKGQSDPRESPLAQHRREETEAGSIIVVPLIFQDTVYGTMTALNRPDQRDFARGDVDLMVAIAAQVAVTVHNLTLYQSVAEERQRLQALVQSTHDGVILISMELNVLIVNQSTLDYLGLDGEPEDWIDVSLWEALRELRSQAPTVARALLHEMRRIKAGDEPVGSGEYRVGSRDVEWFNLPVMRDSKQPLGRLILLRDVTELRVIEAMRRDLTHTMVHDLRNPLTGISGSLTLLSRHAKDLLPENYMSLVEIASSSTKRMLDLVNAILDISRLESGRMPLNRETFHLRALVEDILAMQQALAVSKGIALVNHVPEDMSVEGDRELLGRVVQNLVGNALKFTPAEGAVTITARTTPSDSEKVIVSVRDTGPGIPPEIQQQLFQKFVTGQQEGKGSGLGLAFCRMVLEAHHETIWAASEPGEGAMFSFTLPVGSKKRS
ncbi:MAG: GAF domain-containing protein [Chloroflexi bacterium]|jgi:PAS domain S-box-containing protein|nr:GAF domain-containing protein [Chloroflexota bacterium]